MKAQMETQMETSKKERGAYYSYFLGQNLIYIVVSTYAMLYFTDYVGISPAVIGIIFVVARVWDAINDPLFGIIVDKSNPKKGKYKSWTNKAAIILPLTIILMFMVPDIGMKGKIIYVAVIYIIYGMSYTMADVPIFSIATAMTNNTNERNKMLGMSRVFSLIAALIVSVSIVALTNALGWSLGIGIIAIIAFILMNLMRFNVKERHVAPNNGVTVKKILHTLFTNKYLLIYYGAFTLYTVLNTGTMVSNYFAIYNLGSANYIPVLAMISLIPMIIVSMFVSKLISHFGKYILTVSVSAMMIVSLILYYIVGYQNIVFVFAFSFINGVFMGCLNVMYPMFTADCIEYGAWKTGEKATGISFSLQTFTTKLGQALASGLAGILLSFIGYTPNVEQSASTLKGIFSMVTLIPAIGTFIMLVIFGKFYKLRESDVDSYIKANAKNEIQNN